MSTKKPRKGLSLRTIQIWLIVGAVVVSGLMFYSTYNLSASYRQLTETTQQHIELRKAALELMEASDYMTEKVQRFAVKGDFSHLQAYFNEALVTQHREEALRTMSQGDESAAALAKLKQALKASNALMEKEYYAMRLVIEANGHKNYPLELQKVTLSAEDKALSAEQQQALAVDIVFDNSYYERKNEIHNKMQESLDELEKQVNEKDEAALKQLRERMIVMRTVIVLQTAGILFLVWLASHLGIHPILNAVERIKNNKKLPEAGTSEFRYLVRAYNKMYEAYQKSLDRLQFKASHDELTGVYNRAGYESLIAGLDLDNTYMFLFDVDDFKHINDTYGHETGDKVLVKLVEVLKSNFRPDDFICRIGGDEFVVFMQHTPAVRKEMIAEKMENINTRLEKEDDDLPELSISVGIVHGSVSHDVQELFEKADEAMYRSKQSGKRTYTFYTDEAGVTQA